MTKPIYVPALRLKQGEYRGLRRLSPDIADKILPRLVVPPPKERDPEKKRPLTKDEIIYETGRRIANHWPLRDTLLDVRFLFGEFGEIESAEWLPRIFDIARDAGAKPMPMAVLSDATAPRIIGVRRALAEGNASKIGICVNFAEMDDNLPARIDVLMTALGVRPDDCTVLADFAEADFSNPETVAEIAQRALEDLQALGRWRQVVFQGTNYPPVNPAKPNSSAIIPRNEWLAWKKAIKLDGKSPDHLVFGDYGADCAEFKFSGKSGGIPIRHYRYTTPESWLVVRGMSGGIADAVMRDVCERILASGQFAGRRFSSADDYIFKTANGLDGPGSGTTWREINTAHHITRVVRDIGTIKGMSFADVRISDPVDQFSLFDSRT
jgi:hypothetical protein